MYISGGLLVLLYLLCFLLFATVVCLFASGLIVVGICAIEYCFSARSWPPASQRGRDESVRSHAASSAREWSATSETILRSSYGSTCGTWQRRSVSAPQCLRKSYSLSLPEGSEVYIRVLS